MSLSPTRLLVAAGAAALLTVFHAGCSGGGASGDAEAASRKRAAVLSGALASHGCTNCHVDSGALLPARGARPLPVGHTVAREALERHLAAPDEQLLGCPDVLRGVAAEDRREAEQDLLHWLATGGVTAEDRTLSPADWNPVAGEELFHAIGCFACHDADAMDAAGLADRTTVPALAAFLEAPSRARPTGWHPAMSLTEQEALWIASWLLREQEPRLERALDPGLLVQSFEFEASPGSVADLEGLEPVAVAVAAEVSIEPRTRDERFGLVFEGLLQVAENAPAAVYTRSDDGSRMWIDGEVVVENDGTHPPQTRSGEVALAPGLHTLRIEMFEAGGGEALSAGWLVGGEEQPFTAGELWHGSLALPATGWDGFTADVERVQRGAEIADRSCMPCHRGAEAPPMPALSWGDAEAGCLAETPTARAPDFGLDPVVRATLREAVQSAAAPDARQDAAARVFATLHTLQCTACHARDDMPAREGGVMQHFTGSDDLGDEGTVPPDLTGVGAKLTYEHLERVLAGEGRVRPYMNTRMPHYAAALMAALPADLEEADAGAFGDVQPWDPAAEGGDPGMEAHAAAIAAGRELAGTGGFACVTCHTVAGERGPGIQGMDLAVMAGRVRPEWFRRWVLDPPAIRPGTRMPAFFPDGQSTQPDAFDGSAEAQVGALWAYLSLGPDMPLPEGVMVDAGAYELVPVEAPVYVGVFFEGLSARTTCVGFPERVHAAFDLHHARLGVVWKGDFLTVAGTWQGRAGQLEKPAASPEQVRRMPAGPPFARLATPDAPWPTATGKEAGWRMRAHRRDAGGHPTWIYAKDRMVVEETLVPSYAADGARLTRRFRVSNPGEVPAALRAWIGTGMNLEARGAVFRMRGEEVLVDVPAGADGMEFEVEMDW